MPAAAEADVDIVIGGAYSSGVLAGGSILNIRRQALRSWLKSKGSRLLLNATGFP